MDKLLTGYGKTLRELLSSVNFDDIVPLILSDKDSVCSLSKFKEAYDILLQTSSSRKYSPNIHIFRADKDVKRLWASVEGCNWEDLIDGDIYLEDGPPVTDAMIAYALLWHLTFYGYDDRSKEDAYREITSGSRYDNKYGRLAFDTEVRRDWLLADAKTRKDIMASIESNRKEGWMSYSLSEEQWDAIEHHRTHCNAAKRKRDARLRRRIARLENLSLQENTLSRLFEGQKGTDVTRKHLSFLCDGDRRCGCEFQSHACDAGSRLQYITDLVKKYNAAHLSEPASQIALRIATSAEYPLSGTERDKITNLIKEQTGAKTLIRCEAEDDALGPEISIMIVGSVK